GPMARRLVETGFTVTGFEPDQARAGKAKADGVVLATSPARVAEASDMVLSSLPDVATVRRAYEAADGAIAGARAGMTFIDVSTTDPESWREVAKAAKAKGVECLDAPVSGGPTDAGSGKLIFLIGGEAAVLERCRPVLSVLGHEIHHIGPLGSGQIIKIVNNVMSVGNVAVAAEAMVLGVRAGLDPQRLYDILSTSGGRAPDFIKRFPNVLAGDFTPYFGINLSRKDVAIGLNMAASLGLPMPVTSAVRQTYDTAHAEGFGSLDMAGVISLYEKWAGVEVRSKTGKPTAYLARRRSVLRIWLASHRAARPVAVPVVRRRRIPERWWLVALWSSAHGKGLRNEANILENRSTCRPFPRRPSPPRRPRDEPHHSSTGPPRRGHHGGSNDVQGSLRPRSEAWRNSPIRCAGRPEDPGPSVGDRLHHAQSRLSRVRHAVRHGRAASDQTADGRAME